MSSIPAFDALTARLGDPLAGGGDFSVEAADIGEELDGEAFAFHGGDPVRVHPA